MWRKTNLLWWREFFLENWSGRQDEIPDFYLCRLNEACLLQEKNFARFEDCFDSD